MFKRLVPDPPLLALTTASRVNTLYVVKSTVLAILRKLVPETPPGVLLMRSFLPLKCVVQQMDFATRQNTVTALALTALMTSSLDLN